MHEKGSLACLSKSCERTVSHCSVTMNAITFLVNYDRTSLVVML